MATGIAAILGVLGIAFLLFRRMRRPLMPESLWRVEFDETRIVVTHPQGEPKVVRWAKLTKVAVRTTDDGPFDMDLFWGFHEDGSGEAAAVFPGGATGEGPFLEALASRLPNLRAEQITKAMSSTSNDYFVIWESGNCGKSGHS